MAKFFNEETNHITPITILQDPLYSLMQKIKTDGPKKDGLTVVNEVIAEDPNAKIILITASDDQKTIDQCLEQGATSYISKPFDFNGVLKAISDILEK